VAINVNDEVGHYFQTNKGLRQGNSLSLLPFNIVADMLAIIIKRENIKGQVSGVVPHFIDGGVYILQFVDDIILFLEHDLEKAHNMKLLPFAFEQISGLKKSTSIRAKYYAFMEVVVAPKHNIFGVKIENSSKVSSCSYSL
jgi:hypothetical protein